MNESPVANHTGVNEDGRLGSNIVEDVLESRTEEGLDDNRKIGKKSSRSEESHEGMNEVLKELMRTMREEREENRIEMKRREEAHKTEMAQQRRDLELLIAAQRASSAQSTATSTGDSTDGLQFLMQERATFETSKGKWKSQLLEQEEELPADWPTYSWPKNWKGRHSIVKALVMMHDLQRKFTLTEAVMELKTNLRIHKKFLKQWEWRLVEPFFDEKMADEVKNGYIFRQDAYEICLIGMTEFAPAIANMLQVCRRVQPVKMQDSDEWGRILLGSEWPRSSSFGVPVGYPKDSDTWNKKPQGPPKGGKKAILPSPSNKGN